MTFRQMMGIYFENRTKHINTACGQNTEFLKVAAGGSCSNQCALDVNSFEHLKNTVVC
jgi:hypothetical protein